MASGTNRDRVLALIKEQPGLTDSEIRRRTGIEPHQQVNQICRSLAAAGFIRRIKGSRGHIVNLSASGKAQPTEAPSARRQSPSSPHQSNQCRRTSVRTSGLPSVRLADCLFVVPCSGAKTSGGAGRAGASVVDGLPPRLADELVNWRIRNAQTTRVDESALRPAVERYDGYFYEAGRSAIEGLIDQGASVLIISGGYGLVLPDERIGMYNCEFQPKMWPNRLIEQCLAGFAAEAQLKQVIGVLSATSSYARVFRRTRWPSTVVETLLVTPERVSDGRIKAPRAEGEALATIAEKGHLLANWRSTDGLAIEVERP